MNKTPNYALNQWEADDRVQRVDFNADNAKIDAALGTLASRISAVDDKGLRLHIGSYVGTGTASRSLDFGPTLGRPARVLVLLGTKNLFLTWEKPTSTVATWSASFAYDAHNEKDVTYYYFVFG